MPRIPPELLVKILLTSSTNYVRQHPPTTRQKKSNWCLRLKNKKQQGTPAPLRPHYRGNSSSQGLSLILNRELNNSRSRFSPSTSTPLPSNKREPTRPKGLFASGKVLFQNAHQTHSRLDAQRLWARMRNSPEGFEPPFQHSTGCQSKRPCGPTSDTRDENPPSLVLARDG